MKKEMEIERKFLVDDSPDLTSRRGEMIRQGFFPIADDEISIRVRQRVEQFFLTIKIGKGLERHEKQVTITEDQFEQLWPLTKKRRIRKTRYHLTLDDHRIDFDLYHDALEGFMTAEVEFSSVDDAQAFSPPPWFGREVTEDIRYTNEMLARNGLPKV